MNEESKHFFTRGPVASLKSSGKISSYLVRAKLYPVQRSVGPFDYRKPCCHICIYVNQTDSFTSAVTGETHKINDRFD